MRGDEPDFRADRELVEISVDDAVPMEIDLISFGVGDKAVIGKHARDAAVRRRLVMFHVLPVTSNEVLEFAIDGVKGIPDGDIHVLVGVFVVAFVVDHHLATGDRNDDSQMVEPAFAMMVMGSFDDDAAIDDVVVKPRQPFGPLLYPRLDGGGRIHIVKAQLQWHGHGASQTFSENSTIVRCCSHASSRRSTGVVVDADQPESPTKISAPAFADAS